MAQRLANYKCAVTLKGKNEDSIQRVYDAMAPRSRNNFNKRTGRPWTEFDDIKIKKEKDSDLFVGNFVVTRDAIRGNHQNDVKEMARTAAVKLNVDVDCEVNDATRALVEEPAEEVVEDKTEKAE
jgi:hypothetical protein